MDLQAWLYLCLVGAVAVWLPTHGRRLWARWQRFTAWEATQHQDDQPAHPEPRVLSTAIVVGAGTALQSPPADLRAHLSTLRGIGAAADYTFPIGWRLVNDKPSLAYARFVGDVNHIALTGFTDSGKDSWAMQAFLYLATTMPPSKLQLAIVDGKDGLSWLGWGNKQHVWLLAEAAEQIKPAMERLKLERSRRAAILKRADCEKWDEYTGHDLPLLVVFISELMLLQDATSKGELADWLNTELTSARAMGIRYIVSGQTFTRLDTRWRSQIGLYIAGYQPRGDADEPNTSFSTKELRERGLRADGRVVGVPPSDLPVPPDGAGVFTCVQGRTVLTVRCSYFSKDHRRWVLQQLPSKSLVTTESVQNDARTPERLNANSGHMNGLERDSERSEPLPIYAEKVNPERLNANADELQKLGKAVRLYQSNGRKQAAIETAFGITKGGGQNWRRASELFDMVVNSS